jgi:hypothetical protein
MQVRFAFLIPVKRWRCSVWIALTDSNRAFNLGQICSAEWDEADQWVDLVFADGHSMTITGPDALSIIDSVINIARMHDQNVSQTLKAYSQMNQSEESN